ncbi:MAG: mechanosensitive ion channel [Rhodospirillales bacterium]|nr:mechanosensitive ion channel [Rhodospirillales bacterium]MDH3966072.1 mechanosensitive ion channel [Rhodospirillales bacterium]
MFFQRSLTTSLISCAVVGLVLLMHAGSGAAQVPATMLIGDSGETGTADRPVPEALLSGELSAEERRDLLARLSDSQIRELMLQYLDTAAGASAGPDDTPGFIDDFEDTAARVRKSQREMLGAIDELPSVVPFLLNRLAAGRDKSDLPLILVAFAVILLAGFAAEWLFRRMTRNYGRRIQEAVAEGMTAKLGYFAARLVLELLNLGVFWLAAIGVFFVMYQGHEPSRWVILTYLSAVVLFRVVAVVSQSLLAPSTPALRMVPLNDVGAHLLHNRVILFAAVAVFSFHTAALFQLLGLDWRVIQLFNSINAIVMVAVMVVTIWQGRKPVAELIRGEAPPVMTATYRIRGVIAEIWHILAICYVAVIAVLSRIGSLLTQEPVAGRGIGSLLVVIAVPLADGAIRQVLIEYFAAKRAERSDEETAVSEDGYEVVVLRAARIVLVLAGTLVFLRIWGVDIFALSRTGFGVEVSRAVLHVGLTALLAYVGWALAKTAIDRRLALEGGGAAGPGDEGGGHGTASRLKTLLPLFRRFLFVTIVAMAVMIVLSSLGVQIGPLLAGAGVIGIAIGFGAQTLVRDIVSGVFFLLDDAFRMGEYVDVGVAKGMVERITVRSLVLRHHRGPLNIIPFGEIASLTNFSRDWVIMKLHFRVTYDTDVNKVKKIFKKIGTELMADETLGPGFIEPLKSQGVYAMEDSAMIVRAKFMAKPGEQFTIRKEVYRRIQEAFKEHGIKFAHREVTVHVPGVSDQAEPGETPAEAAPPPLSDAQAKAVKDVAAAAALGVLAEEEEAEAAAKGETAA